MSGRPESSSSRILFVVDDGWLPEKIDLFRYLRKEGLNFELATHRHWTLEPLAEFDPIALHPEPLKKGVRYIWLFFWARELETNLTRLMGRLAWSKRSGFSRAWNLVRGWLGRLGLRRKTYAEQLKKLYRGSSQFEEMLNGYDLLIYNPVSVQDKRILFECLQHPSCRLITWVYSWDNPYKDHEWISDASAYLVWNEEGKTDLYELHGVEPDRVEISGAIQFEYLLHLDLTPAPDRERYLLFTCSIAQDEFISQEVDLIVNISELLLAVNPEVTLQVRPYPFRHADRLPYYDRLLNLKNVKLLKYGTINGTVRVSSSEDLVQKAVQLRDAEAVLNLGSTIGLEASFTSAPILQLLPPATGQRWDIREMLKNEHLRFLIRKEMPNVLTTDEEMVTAFSDILSGQTEEYMAYTRALQQMINPDRTHSFFSTFHTTVNRLLNRRYESDHG